MKICLKIIPIFFLLTAVAAAHPLGNFSINQYSRIEPGPSEIKIRQVLDMAEIPSFQESAKIDRDHDGTLSQAELDAYGAQFTPAFVDNLKLAIDGADTPLAVSSANVSVGSGAGNLVILRFVWDLTARVPRSNVATRLSFRNLNYADRLGWNEVVVSSQAVNVFDSNAFGSSITDELRAYPQDSLSSPLAERAADLAFSTTPVPEGSKRLQDRNGRVTEPVQKDRLAELISVGQITPSIVLVGLMIAFGLGALHAISPGHGKTVVGAYLLGSKGNPKQAVFLGVVVTITHTIGVFALGIITLFASKYILPERLMPFLSFVSGLLVFFIGISLFKDRLFKAFGWNQTSHSHGATDSHSHDGTTLSHDGPTHSHGGATHTHLPPKEISLKSLLGLGISGGLLPCPSALVLMLSAISLGRVGYGLILTLMFSVGLATTLTSVGLIFLFVGRAFGSSSLSKNRLVPVIPVLSSFLIACVGVVICYNSLY